MPDQPLEDRTHGTGAIQSPPDERDFNIEDDAAFHEAAAILLPDRYTVPSLPPVLDQGNTPMCVAYSASSHRAWQDNRDLGRFFNFDEALFFRQIGGTSTGAVTRNALERMRWYGYPIYVEGKASEHRISAYFTVTQAITTIKTALMTFGPLLMVGPWYNNWIYGLRAPWILPSPDFGGSGHQVMAIGWNESGLRFRNSWSAAWADGGDAVMPWYYVVNSMWELWRTVDVRTARPQSDHGWDGRVRVNGPECNIRTSARTDVGNGNLWARSGDDGWTYRMSDHHRLWKNAYQYFYDGKLVRDFYQVRTHSHATRYIHRSAAHVTVKP